MDRIQLPPGTEGDVATGQAWVCEGCGHLHTQEQQAAVCDHCSSALGDPQHNLLQLHTVFTKRRDRISSDEEERQRTGYAVEVSYAFARNGEFDGSLRAQATGRHGGTIADLAYGDSATVRLTNLGYRRSVAKGQKGFWLNPYTGEWLSSKKDLEQPGRAVGDEEAGLADGDKAEHRQPVVPFVQDTRNILVLKLAEPVDRSVAITLQYALERGIEAEFQLEDSELDTEQLPPWDGPRDRILFIESAEGGAGVLRRLQAEPDALAKAAQKALEIAHFDRDGGDRGHEKTGEPCVMGCYNCLLSFGNQRHHRSIDRRQVGHLLLDFAKGAVGGAHAGRTRDEHAAVLVQGADSGLEQRFVSFLKVHGHRLPDEQQTKVSEALSQPDFVYRLSFGPVSVFIDGPHHDHTEIALRDDEAKERLLDAGWEVVRIRHDDDWAKVVAEYSSVFGEGRR